jgi:co-chaperonin GroES (HSP10)
MKKVLLTLIIAAFVFANGFASDKSLGKKITLKEKTKISKIVENPKSFVGKKVLVEGTVLDVCSKRGCWMEIASDKKHEKIKVKVKDGEIVFPMEAKGKTAVVEGEVYKIEMSKEDAIKMGEHEAKEHGTKFDPASVKGPVVYYQIKGLGAEIKDLK